MCVFVLVFKLVFENKLYLPIFFFYFFFKKVYTVRFVFVFGPENCSFHINSKDYRIINLYQLVTSYGNVKSEILLKLVVIVVVFHMYLVNISANQSNKKSNWNFYKRGEEVKPIKKLLTFCLVCSINSQINITWMMVQHGLGQKFFFYFYFL